MNVSGKPCLSFDSSDAAEAEEILNGPSTSMNHTIKCSHIWAVSTHTHTILFTLFYISVYTFPLTSVLHRTACFHQSPSEPTMPLPCSTSLSQHTHTHKLVLLARSLAHISLSRCRCDI